MQIGKFNCTLKRTGVIEIEYNPSFTLLDKMAIHKFYIMVAKRNKHKLPSSMEFTN